MKYENLMDIPWGYEMQLAEDWGDYPKGTKIIRGSAEDYLDDNESVSFTFPDGCWYYPRKEQIEEISKEKEGVKGSDKVMVELTGHQVAKLYAVLGSCNGVLEPETPVLTEAQKKALELKETIAKAQKQLEELEKEI